MRWKLRTVSLSRPGGLEGVVFAVPRVGRVDGLRDEGDRRGATSEEIGLETVWWGVQS